MKIGFNLDFILGLGIVIFIIIQLFKNINEFMKNPIQELKNNLGFIIVFIICSLFIIYSLNK
tara:strand:- start:281 stop:466 length:186 start_codon:yes stop_codon:yes gene_type:complete